MKKMVTNTMTSSGCHITYFKWWVQESNSIKYGWGIDFQQGCEDHSMGQRIVFSINGAGTARYAHATEWIWTPTSHSYIINSK